jgi:MoaA/NifB/PqqE/SkfB family radical SAM enzyme
MCGNHGDPIYHADFHGLISSLRADQPHVRFDIITNGAHRSTSWWETTARLLVPGDRITFSIDGMPHNNHQYRINSRWQSIEDAVIVLRKHGLPQLDLTWKWILFRYNEDEVQAGIDLAKQLGFNRFTLVDSIRNEPGETLTPTRSINSILEHVHA